MMNVSKTIIWLVVVASFLSAQTAYSQADQGIPDGLVQTAEEGLMEFLTKSDPAVLARSCVWWQSDDDPENYVLGKPYPIYILDLNLLGSINDVKDFKNSLTLVKWSIPVSYDNEPRLLIGIMNRNGEWKCGGFGRDPNPIIHARTEWPQSEGYRHCYIMSGNGPDFLAIEKELELFFYPFNRRNEYLLDIQLDEKGRYPIIPFDTMIMKLLDAKEEGKIQG